MNEYLKLDIIDHFLQISPQFYFAIYIITKSIILYGNHLDELDFEEAVKNVIGMLDEKLKMFSNNNIDYRKLILLDEYLQSRYNNILFKQFCVHIKNTTEIHPFELIPVSVFVDQWKDSKEHLLLLFNYITLFNTEHFDFKKIAQGDKNEIDKYRFEKLFYLLNIDEHGNEKELTKYENEFVNNHIKVFIKCCGNISNEIDRRQEKWYETNDCEDIEYFEEFDIINKKERKRFDKYYYNDKNDTSISTLNKKFTFI
jgi:hypothetical protein